MAGEALKIVLADEHRIFVDALTSVLTAAGHHVVAAVSDHHQVVHHVRIWQPDIALVGNYFVVDEDADVFDEIAAASPATKVVMLTADGSAASLHRALDAGVAGYVLKTRSIGTVLDALGRVHSGEVVVEGSFQRASAPQQPTMDFRRLSSYLTPRELECLVLLGVGLDTPALCVRLGISRTTVRTHVQSILIKLGVHSRLEAVALAVRYGVIPPPADPGGLQLPA